MSPIKTKLYQNEREKHIKSLSFFPFLIQKILPFLHQHILQAFLSSYPNQFSDEKTSEKWAVQVSTAI